MDDGQWVTLSGWQGATSGLRVDAESRRLVFLPLKGVLGPPRYEAALLPGGGDTAELHVSQ